MTTRGIGPGRPGTAMPTVAGVRSGGRPTGLELTLPPPWTRDALCSQTDPEAFFPEKGQPTRRAKAICARCQVRAECLAYALKNRERFGIWGGLSAMERRALERGMNLPRAIEKRNAEILRLTACGWTSAQIANRLRIGQSTVWHVRSEAGQAGEGRDAA